MASSAGSPENTKQPISSASNGGPITSTTSALPEQTQVVSGEDSPIEIDGAAGTDSDSAFEETLSSYTTSVTSSIVDYKYENGRRYHAFRAGNYVMPNDEEEQNRLDLMHHIFNMMFKGELHKAPLINPQRILDVGTGTGIWAIAVADLYPSAEVIGLDLSPIQPGWVPPNLTFQIDDAESDWTFPRGTLFDHIYLRGMAGSIGDWPRLLRQAYDQLQPGGWLELTEFEAWASTDDDSLPATSHWTHLQDAVSKASAMHGREMNAAPRHKQRVIDAGFEDVRDDIMKIPLSPWPKDPKLKELGRFMQVQMIDAVESYSMALCTRVLGWDITKTSVMIAGARGDLRNRDYHMFSRCHCVYGRKPLK